MTTAEKIIRAKTDYDNVYEAGMKAENDRFWNSYQSRGYETGYLYAFSGTRWTDSVYNPKYTLKPSGNASYMFLYSRITDTKVTIDLSNTTSNILGMFANSTIKTIRKIIFGENNPIWNKQFENCSNLENITAEGVLAKSISLQWCTKLTHDSLMSIIGVLKDYSTDTSGTVYTITLGEENLAKLTEDEKEIITNKGWQYG